MTVYPKVGWQEGTGPRLFPGLVQMDDGIESAHQEIEALQAPNTVLNIATLKAQTTQTADSLRHVLGYYAANDGGGGVFRWNASSTSADNGGTVIIPNSAPGSGRWERLTNGFLSVRWFGAKGDGTTNDTPAFAAATLAASTAAKDKVVYVPAGTYLLRPGNLATVITIYSGTSLVGDGYSSVLKVDVSILTLDTAYWLFAYQSNTRIRNLRIDGQKAALNRTPLTHMGVATILAAATATNNVVVEDLWIHDLPAVGAGAESAGVMQNTGGCYNIRYRRIEGWGCEGTPISVDGLYPGGQQTNNVEVDECKAYNNTYHGITLFGVTNVRVRDSLFYNNSLCGLNNEFATDIDIYGCKMTGNGRGGIDTASKSSFRAFDCTLAGNNPTLEWGEVVCWWSTWTDGSNRSVAGTVELHNCSVTPPAGGTHLYYEEDAAVAIGNSQPDRILVACQGAKDWTYRSNIATDTLPSSLVIKDQPEIGRVVSERLLDWTTASSSVAAYTGTDRTSTDAAALSTSTQFGNLSSKYILKANRQYLVSIRAKADSAHRWMLFANGWNGAGVNNLYHPKATVDIGTWFTSSYVINAGSVDRKLQLMMADVPGGTRTFSVDYINVTELHSSPHSHRYDQQAEAALVWRSAIPTSGTWTIPSIVYHSAPTASGFAGWVLTVPGTAGTYAEGRTAATTNGSPNVTLSGTTTVLKPGDYLTINAQAKRISSISGTTMVMDSNFSSTGGAQAISYTAPTFKTFGAISA